MSTMVVLRVYHLDPVPEMPVSCRKLFLKILAALLLMGGESLTKVSCEDNEFNKRSREKNNSSKCSHTSIGSNDDILFVKPENNLNNINRKAAASDRSLTNFQTVESKPHVYEQNNNKLRAEWRQLSRILGRLFLLISVLIFITINISIFCVVN